MPINTELLEKVKQHILEEPRRYDQGTWGGVSDEAPCGTRACIAGWTIHLGGRVGLETLQQGGGKRSVFRSAQRLLRLSDEEAQALFTGDPSPCGCGEPSCGLNEWPYRFARRYQNAKTARGRAGAAAAYLDWIIRTGKVIDDAPVSSKHPSLEDIPF